MERMAEFVATEPNRILSDEQMQYVNLAAELRRQAVSDPYLSGQDSRGRVNPTEPQRLEEAARCSPRYAGHIRTSSITRRRPPTGTSPTNSA
jgi:hypothetical protein